MKFVSDKEQAARILVEQLTELLDGDVVNHETRWGAAVRLVLARRSKRTSRAAARPPSRAPFSLLLPIFLASSASLASISASPQSDMPPIPEFLLQILQRPQSLLHGWRLHRTWAADDHAPQIRDDSPVIVLLGSDTNAVAQRRCQARKSMTRRQNPGVLASGGPHRRPSRVPPRGNISGIKASTGGRGMRSGFEAARSRRRAPLPEVPAEVRHLLRQGPAPRLAIRPSLWS